ncbi:MAG: DUF1015 domain-containing protein [Bacillota bacterium]|jgi:hypothetical protein
MDFANVALQIPEVLLPQAGVDLTKWAVVACDQFTSQPEYWEKVAASTGGAPSTLDLIFPEVYLGKGHDSERIDRINANMSRYLDTGLLVSPGAGLIYLERQTAHGNLRKGLIVAVDLEAYDYRRGAASLVRATEGTVLDRLPPRVKIRERAVLELPHIMLLIDDPEATVIQPLAAQTGQLTKLYDTDLLLGGGHVTGYLVNDPAVLTAVSRALTRLAEPDYFNRKYGLNGASPLLFAVGDGNHSLATAKAVWEKLKGRAEIDRERHPARYALVELVNLHDPGLQFEPIHRVLFQVSGAAFNAYLTKTLAPLGLTRETPPNEAVMLEQLSRRTRCRPGSQTFGMVTADGATLVTVARPRHNLTVGTVQKLLDDWVRGHPESMVDYIHGAAVGAALGVKPGNIGFFLPPIAKSDLFKTVIVDGALPRKTFSMGAAAEKRYYLECRRIG